MLSGQLNWDKCKTKKPSESCSEETTCKTAGGFG